MELRRAENTRLNSGNHFSLGIFAAPPFFIIVDYGWVVKTERAGEFIRREEKGAAGIVTGAKAAITDGGKDDGNGVMARVSGRFRVSSKLLKVAETQAGFFFGLSPGGILKGFPVIDKAPRQCPAEGWIAPFDQDDFFSYANDDVHSLERDCGIL